MSKETFWFRHDYDAADDDKTMVMIEQLGLEGYGIYWVLIEKLRGRKDYKMPFSIIPSLARRYMTTPEKMKTVIMQYGLFQYDDEGFFYSESLIRRMNALDELKQRRAIAGKKAIEARWSKEKDTKRIANEYESYSNGIANEQQTNTDAIRLDTDKIRLDKIREEYKEKEEEINSSSKRKRNSKPFVKPTVEELDEYIKEKGYHFDAESFFSFYESKGWMIGKNRMKNWKMACVTWENSRGFNSSNDLFSETKQNEQVVIDGQIYR